MMVSPGHKNLILFEELVSAPFNLKVPASEPLHPWEFLNLKLGSPVYLIASGRCAWTNKKDINKKNEETSNFLLFIGL